MNARSRVCVFDLTISVTYSNEIEITIFARFVQFRLKSSNVFNNKRVFYLSHIIISNSMYASCRISLGRKFKVW